MSKEECDLDVFVHGVSVGIFNMTRDEADIACEEATKVTGDKHDWHYAMGRVHIKRLVRDLAAEAEYASWDIAPAQGGQS